MRILMLLSLVFLMGCSSFKAQRVDGDEADEKALEITDKWVMRDTENVVQAILKQMKRHKTFQRYLRQKGEAPKLFVAEVQNNTSNAYFPVDDLNDELLNEFSMSGDFILIDEKARQRLLKEIKYQNDGMVDPREAKMVGKQAGADLLIFGNIRMKPETRKGKTIKQYSVNLRMTNIERGTEVWRGRAKVNKYSEQSSSGW